MVITATVFPSAYLHLFRCTSYNNSRFFFFIFIPSLSVRDTWPLAFTIQATTFYERKFRQHLYVASLSLQFDVCIPFMYPSHSSQLLDRDLWLFLFQIEFIIWSGKLHLQPCLVTILFSSFLPPSCLRSGVSFHLQYEFLVCSDSSHDYNYKLSFNVSSALHVSYCSSLSSSFPLLSALHIDFILWFRVNTPLLHLRLPWIFRYILTQHEPLISKSNYSQRITLSVSLPFRDDRFHPVITLFRLPVIFNHLLLQHEFLISNTYVTL